MTLPEILARSRAAQPAWAASAIERRCELVRALGQRLADDADSAVAALRRDLRKPTIDALSGDLFVPLEAMRYFAKRAPKVLRPRKIGVSSPFLFRSRYRQTFAPYGCVLILAPFNYPIQLTLIPAVCALLAGNSVIIKGSEWTPETNTFLRRLFESAGFPEGLVQFVVGDAAVGRELCRMSFDKIFVTGGSETGRSVSRSAAERLVPVDLELGGKDVLVVGEDAPLTKAAKAACFSAFLNSGQVCIGTKRILVHSSRRDEFLSRLRSEVASVRLGESGEEEMGPLVRAAEIARVKEILDDAVAKGATLETPWIERGNLLGPLVVSGNFRGERILNEEVFAPLLCVDSFSSDDELIEKANGTPFGLQAAILSKDLAWAERIAERLCVGVVSINEVVVPIGNPAAPFGGEKLSGHGRSRGDEGILSFCRRKTISRRPSSEGRERHFFPYSTNDARSLRRIISFLYGGGSLWSRARRLLRS